MKISKRQLKKIIQEEARNILRHSKGKKRRTRLSERRTTSAFEEAAKKYPPSGDSLFDFVNERDLDNLDIEIIRLYESHFRYYEDSEVREAYNEARSMVSDFIERSQQKTSGDDILYDYDMLYDSIMKGVRRHLRASFEQMYEDYKEAGDPYADEYWEIAQNVDRLIR